MINHVHVIGHQRIAKSHWLAMPCVSWWKPCLRIADQILCWSVFHRIMDLDIYIYCIYIYTVYIYILYIYIYIYCIYIYIFGSIFADDIESIDGMAHCRQVDRFRADFVFAELRGCGGFGFYRFRLFLMQLLNWLSISLNATQYLRFP